MIYKLIFRLKTQKNNIRSYIMSGITFSFIILLVVHIIKVIQKKLFTQRILRIKLNYETSDKKTYQQTTKNRYKEKKKKNNLIYCYYKGYYGKFIFF